MTEHEHLSTESVLLAQMARRHVKDKPLFDALIDVREMILARRDALKKEEQSE